MLFKEVHIDRFPKTKNNFQFDFLGTTTASDGADGTAAQTVHGGQRDGVRKCRRNNGNGDDHRKRDGNNNDIRVVVFERKRRREYFIGRRRRERPFEQFGVVEHLPDGVHLLPLPHARAGERRTAHRSRNTHSGKTNLK